MNKLYRYPQNGYLGGVCHGFAVYTKTDHYLAYPHRFCRSFNFIHSILGFFKKEAFCVSGQSKHSR